MRRVLSLLVIVAALSVAAGLWLTAARTAPDGALAGLTGDAAAGEAVFHAAGCSSCHAAPGAAPEESLVLAGGEAFASDFGTFFAPNISPSPAGIGGWGAQDLLNALRHGTTPGGQHYYPAFPYGAYRHMTDRDVVDLHAFLQTLPPSDTASRAHDAPFPFSIRRGLGVWKLLFLRPGWTLDDAATPQIERGRYLVEALGHCAECHTPRGLLGQLDRSRWMQGAPNPSGRGRIPGITPAILKWSAGDIAYYLETGFTPDFDSAGGKMAAVVRNISKLPAEDRQAIAAYLMALE